MITMVAGKSYTIHKGKKRQTKISAEALERLRENLAKTACRMKTVGKLDDIEFINDTRSLDLLSTRDSFKCLDSPSIWVTTTTAYDRDFSLIEECIEEKIRAIVVYSAKAMDMRDQLEKFVETFITVADLREAVRSAFKLAKANDKVIYSPACVVEDGYSNFVERGRVFEKIVTELEFGG